MVLRYDMGGRLQKATPVGSGGMRVPAYVTLAGILEYRTTDGRVVRELRSEEEVFHEDSLASLEHIAVTVRHPGEPVTAESWRRDSVGFVGSKGARAEDIYVASPLIIQDSEALEGLDAGEYVECSPGYRCDIDDTPGTHPKFGPYDRAQTNIRYNHVAVLREGEGRSGSRVAVRLDASDNMILGDTVTPKQPKANMKYEIDGVTYDDVPLQLVQALDRHLGNKNQELATVRKDAAAEVAAAAALATEAKLTADKAIAKAEALEASTDELVTLRTDAAKSLGDDFDFSGLTATEIRIAVLKATDITLPEGASDDYVAGAYSNLATLADTKRNDAKGANVRTDAVTADNISNALFGADATYYDEDAPAAN